ncbi:MAG: hypothetical protein M3N10_00385 [Actinomycetota bacterium]|nr:hypothetical protein [Actinomycetota bacterium]HZY65734.1 hypothetical protein [Rubrobacteraceae bacterium]
MSIARYYTIGAVVPDLGALKALDERLEDFGVPGNSLLVLIRRRDERLTRVSLPEANIRKVESGLTRMQWFEFGSMFLGVTATSVLMGAIHLWTGVVVETLLVVGSLIGLLLYYRQPRLEKKLLSMGLPEKLAEEWEGKFPSGYALALVTVPGESFEDVEGMFTEDESLEAPLAVDRRPVL